MTERITVELRLLGQQYKGELKDMESRTEQFGSGVLGMAAKNERAFNTVGRAATVGGAAVLAGVGVAVNAAKNFEKEMSGVAAVANATAPEMKALADAAIEAGQATAFSAQEAAKAEAELVKAGVSVADVLGGALRGSLDLAAAGQLDLAEAAEISAQAMNIFNLEGKDVAHIADVLAAGANKSAADVGQLGQALRQGGLLAAQTGLTLEETVGTLAAFSDEALVGSDAGTSLKTMLQRLTPQSDEAAQTMRELGFSAFDAQGEFIGMEGLARELTEAMGHMSTEQRNAAMQILFGSDAVRGANVLMKLGAEGVREYTEAVNDEGAAARMAATQMDNLSGDLEELSGSIETALIKFGQQGTGVLRDLTQAATGAVNVFSNLPEPIQGAALGLTSLAGAAGVAVGGFFLLLPRIAETRQAMQTLDITAARLKGSLVFNVGAAAAGAFAAASVAKVMGNAFVDATRGAVPAVKDLTLALEGLGTAGEAPESVVGSLRGLEQAIERVADPQLTDRLWGPFHAPQVDNARGKVAALDQALVSLVETGKQDQAAEGFERIAESAAASGVPVEELREMLPGYAKALDGAALSQAKAADETTEHERALAEAERQAEDTAEEYDTLTEAVDAQIDALRRSTDPAFAALDSLDALAEGQNELNEAIKEHGRDSAEAREAQSKLAKQALVTQEDMLFLAAAVKDGSTSISTIRRRFEELEAQGMIPPGTTESVIRRLQEVVDQAHEVEANSPTVSVGADLDGALRSLHGFDVYLDQVTRNRTVHISTTGTKVSGGRVHTGGFITGSGIQRFHEGGQLGRFPHDGTLRSLGLASDEVPLIGQTGETILSRQQTAAMRQLIGVLPRYHAGGTVGYDVASSAPPPNMFIPTVVLKVDGREFARATGRYVHSEMRQIDLELES